jgi:prepilin-type N-terminal cleavage/methylation domain-containing protein
MTKKYLSISGFTLVETLVAITILLVGITGAFTAASQGLMSSSYSKEQVQATYLAQEGVEMIRNLRDTNGIHTNQGETDYSSWLRGIAEPGDPCEIGSVCTVDATGESPILAQCSGVGECPPLRQDANRGLYGYSGAYTSVTPFVRQIQIKPVATQADTGEVEIVVTVSWSHGIISKQFVVRENIFNWQR